MPRVNGLEVLRWLHEHRNGRPSNDRLLGIAHGSGRQEAYQLGASSYFVKPTGFHELMELVKIMYNYWERAERPPVPENC